MKTRKGKGRSPKGKKKPRGRDAFVPDAIGTIGPYGVPDNRLQKRVLVENEPL